MVHLTFNDTECRKCAFKCKIELCKRYHSETPCKVCPKQPAALSISGLYQTAGKDHAGAISSLTVPKRSAVQALSLPTVTRSRQPDRSSLPESECIQFGRLPRISPEKSGQPQKGVFRRFLRISKNPDFCTNFRELHLIIVIRHSQKHQNPRIYVIIDKHADFSLALCCFLFLILLVYTVCKPPILSRSAPIFNFLNHRQP